LITATKKTRVAMNQLVDTFWHTDASGWDGGVNSSDAIGHFSIYPYSLRFNTTSAKFFCK
jgi:hypothetical protein